MSSQKALLASALIGGSLTLAYFLARGGLIGPQQAFLQTPNLGIIAGLGSALYLSLVAAYFCNLHRSRTALEAEVQTLLATAHDLQARNAKAVRACDAKSEYLAKMSHELRTPMTAVIGYSEILIEDMVAAGKQAQSADVGKIYDTGKHLLTLINDVLDISKIDAGKMQLFPESVPLEQLLSDMTAGCAAQGARNGNKVVFGKLENSAMVEVDCRKLRQVIGNLVGMANHVVRQGEILVTAAAQDGWINFSVSTAGGDFVAENAAHVFDDLDAGSAENTQDGVLGFALTKKLCRLMGGALRQESKGQDCFRVSIRIPASATAVMAATAPRGGTLAEFEDQLFMIPEMLSQPLADKSLLMTFFRNCYRWLFPGRDKVMLVS